MERAAGSRNKRAGEKEGGGKARGREPGGKGRKTGGNEGYTGGTPPTAGKRMQNEIF